MKKRITMTIYDDKTFKFLQSRTFGEIISVAKETGQCIMVYSNGIQIYVEKTKAGYKKRGGKLMPLSKDMTHSEIVEELMHTYHTAGEIGGYKPSTEAEALQIANAIAFRIKGEA